MELKAAKVHRKGMKDQEGRQERKASRGLYEPPRRYADPPRKHAMSTCFSDRK